jgi:hypothetical protein
MVFCYLQLQTGCYLPRHRQVLEFNHSPELFCRRTEGLVRRENNAAVVKAFASVLACTVDASASSLKVKEAIAIVHRCANETAAAALLYVPPPRALSHHGGSILTGHPLYHDTKTSRPHGAALPDCE